LSGILFHIVIVEAISWMAFWILGGREVQAWIKGHRPGGMIGSCLPTPKTSRLSPKINARCKGIRKVREAEPIRLRQTLGSASLAPHFTPDLEKYLIFPRKNAPVRILAG